MRKAEFSSVGTQMILVDADTRPARTTVLRFGEEKEGVLTLKRQGACINDGRKSTLTLPVTGGVCTLDFGPLCPGVYAIQLTLGGKICHLPQLRYDGTDAGFENPVEPVLPLGQEIRRLSVRLAQIEEQLATVRDACFGKPLF